MRYIMVFLLSFSLNSVFGKKNEINISLRTWESQKERLDEQRKIQKWRVHWDSYISQKQKNSSNLLKSVLMPGWGQRNCENRKKGNIFLGSTIVTFSTAVYLLYQSNNKYKKYKIANNVDDIENYYNSSVNLLKYSQFVFSIGTLIWVANIADSYFTTKSYNRKLLQRFYYSFEENPIVPTIGMKSGKMNIELAYRF